MRPRIAAVCLALAVLGTSCSDSDSNEPAGGSTTTGSTAETVEAAAGPDPTDDELRYRCGGLVFSADDLATVGQERASAAELADAGFVVDQDDRWTLLPGPVAVDAEPLPTTPPALVIAQPNEEPTACVAVRDGAYDQRPVAFAVIDGQLVIEGCVDPAAVTVDERVVDDVAIVSVFGPFPEVDAECAIDSARPVDVEIGGDVLSGVTFPFLPPDPAVNQRLGFGANIVPLPTQGAEAVGCTTDSLPSEVFVQWDQPPPGFTATVSSEERALFSFEPLGLEESQELDQALDDRLLELGRPQRFADTDGPVWVEGFSDFAAPVGETRPYELILVGGAEPVVVSCGAAGITDQVTPTTTTIPSGDLGDLASAKSLFDQRAIGPYAYFTVIPLCGGCPDDSIELQMAPVPSDPSQHEFAPELSEQADPSLPGLVSPFELHDLLASAEAAGSDVTYEVDPSSGLPVVWTIDGEGGRILCFEVDTAPPDLRGGAPCGPGRDLIGSTG